MIPKEKPKLRSVRVQYGGRVLYGGRADEPEARRREKAMRGQLRETGRATGVKSMRPARGCSTHACDAELWAELDVDEMTGEQKLMLAVLEDAKRNLRGGDGLTGIARHRAIALMREATRWIMSDDRSFPFAFASICDAIDVEVADARRALLGKKPS